MIDLGLVLDNLPLYLRGTWTTLWLTFASLALGLVLAVPLGLARTSRNPLLNGPVWAYTYFFRGTPLLVQLFMIYYGAAQFVWVRESVFWPLLSQAWFCALL
ncbi:MAG: ABC transporter permease subunit, partial [Geminicoccaceae bacterium]|nr:ABC transporter permease subunit [Geminicoccaceae bacterium]